MLKTLNVQITSPNGAHNYPAGGLIYCSNCRYILGYLNAEGYQDIRIILRCRCGQIGYIKTVPQKAVHGTVHLLRAAKQEFQCEECGLPLFSLRKNFVSGFTFQITCRCGKNYIKDIMQAEQEKRIPELVKILRKQGKFEKS